MRNPFRRPRGVVDHVGGTVAGDRVFAVNRVVAHLLDVGVRLVEHPFPLAARVIAVEGVHLDRVFAEVINLVERLAGR